MEPFIAQTEDVFELLEEARLISEPIARGDLPYDFTLEQLWDAHTKAGRVLIHLTEKIQHGSEPLAFDDYESLRYAHQSFRTLTAWLERQPSIDTRDRLLLSLCELARIMMWPVVTGVEIVYQEVEEEVASPT